MALHPAKLMRLPPNLYCRRSRPRQPFDRSLGGAKLGRHPAPNFHCQAAESRQAERGLDAAYSILSSPVRPTQAAMMAALEEASVHSTSILHESATVSMQQMAQMMHPAGQLSLCGAHDTRRRGGAAWCNAVAVRNLLRRLQSRVRFKRINY